MQPSVPTKAAQSLRAEILNTLTAVLPALAMYLAIRLRSIMSPGDDAYMTLRYVLNLAAGHGYVYNHGEHVLGTTALYPLLLAFVSWVSGASPLAAGRYFLLPCELLNIALVGYVALRLTGGRLAAGVAALLFALSRYSVFSTLIFMEAPLFSFTLLAATACLLNDHRRGAAFVAGLLAGLAFVCRPEGAIFIAAMLFAELVLKRRINLPLLGGLAAVTIPWLAFAQLAFGSPIPTSMLAKRYGYIPIENQALIWLLEYIGTSYSFAFPSAGLHLVPVLANGVIFTVGAYALQKREPRLFPLLGFTVGLWLAYAAANPFIFAWYLAPLDAGFALAFVGAAWMVAQFLAKALRGRVAGPALFLALVFPTIVARVAWYDGITCETASDGEFQCRGAALTYPHPDVAPKAGLPWGREGTYLQIALDLKDEVNRSTTILSPEFGVLGYYLPAKIVSSVGHVNPEVFRFLPPPIEQVEYPRINNAVTREMVRGLRPDYVISPEVFISRSLLPDPWFAENYEGVAQYPLPFYSGPVYVFRRRNP